MHRSRVQSPAPICSVMRFKIKYTKTTQRTGAGIHLNINISMTLCASSTIFQCECVAISKAVTTMNKEE